jgi:predicted acyltransferase (DUF342 family)
VRFRSIVFALIGLALLTTTFLTAENPSLIQREAIVPIPGAGSYGAVNMEAIDGIGQVKLNGTSVAHLYLTGTLIGINAQIGSLTVSGDVNLSETHIKQEASITGYLRAQRTTFEQPVTLTLQRAVFTTSKLQGVTVLQNMGFKGKQVLELRQNTIIQGPVVFEGGKGEIHLYSGSKVLGEVKGAKVLQK